MKAKSLSLNMVSKPSYLRVRSMLLVLPLLLVAYAVVGTSPAATAAPSIDGSLSVDADTGSVDQGGVVNYTISVHNGSQAGLVTVTDNLPPHTTLLDAPGCTSRNGGSVQCVVPMFPFDDATINVSVSVDSNANCHANLRNTARVHGWPSASADVQVDCAP